MTTVTKDFSSAIEHTIDIDMSGGSAIDIQIAADSDLESVSCDVQGTVDGTNYVNLSDRIGQDAFSYVKAGENKLISLSGVNINLRLKMGAKSKSGTATVNYEIN